MAAPAGKVKISKKLMAAIKQQAQKAGLTVNEFVINVLSDAFPVSGEEVTLEDFVANPDDIVEGLFVESLSLRKRKIKDKEARKYSTELFKAFQKISGDRGISFDELWEEFKGFDYIGNKPFQWLKIAKDIFKGKKILSGAEASRCIKSFGDLDCFAAIISISDSSLPELEKAYFAIKN